MQNDQHYPFTLRFATFLSPVLYDAYAFIASSIGEQIGCPSQLMVGHSLEEFVEGEAPPVVVSKNLDVTLKQSIQALLLNMHRDPQAAKILHQSLIERFVPVTDEHYEDIYRMFTLVQAQEISPILNPNMSKVV